MGYELYKDEAFGLNFLGYFLFTLPFVSCYVSALVCLLVILLARYMQAIPSGFRPPTTDIFPIEEKTKPTS